MKREMMRSLYFLIALDLIVILLFGVHNITSNLSFD